MLKRFSLIGIALGILLVLTASTVVNAQEAYSEGVYFLNTTGGPNHAERLEVTAVKTVDGDWRETVVHFYAHANFRQYAVSHIDTTAVLGEDPDGLEVSDDLGWGGLEGQITVYDEVTSQYHVIEFHVSMPASESSYWEDPNSWYFNRTANLEGYILIDGEVFRDFSRTWMTTETAYNFSDQWPGY
ncbi:MAG: hypothetical protein KC519_08875 [Anaerolineae bacterium]|nr:hypothetical protein [Anaerolineae bacterium]